MQGLIISSVAGVYNVETKSEIFKSKPRGIFRKDNFKPVVGDICRLSFNDEGNGVIEEVFERKNYLVRPPLANIDQIFMVVSTDMPRPNYLVLDQLISIAEKENIKPVILITKSDLKSPDEVFEIYNEIYTTIIVDYKDEAIIEKLRSLISGKVSAFSGNSGVGKSTTLNAIDKRFEIETAAISEKLGRGKHTTREVSLYKLDSGGYIADTPGFSAVDFNRIGNIAPVEVQYTFKDFTPFIGECKFNDCIHVLEIGCSIKKAVEDKKIGASRYSNYTYMVEEAQKQNFWE